MPSLQKSPIRVQLSVLIGTALLLIAALSGVSWWFLSAVGDSAAATYQVSTPRLRVSNELMAAVNVRALSARNLVLVTGAPERQREAAKIAQSHEATGAAIEQLRRMTQNVAADHPQKRLLQAVFDAEAAYGPVALKITDLAVRGEQPLEFLVRHGVGEIADVEVHRDQSLKWAMAHCQKEVMA